jgi:hypothetical protein
LIEFFIAISSLELFAFVVAAVCAFAFAFAFIFARVFAFAPTVTPIFARALALTPTLTLATDEIAAEDLPTPPIEPAIEPSKTILLTKLSNQLFYFDVGPKKCGGSCQRQRDQNHIIRAAFANLPSILVD